MPPSPAARWLALSAALLGWLFDGLEIGLFPLVARPALRELLPAGTGPAAVNAWYAGVTALFLVGAATGGVLFGWLGDRVGRVRALTLSVLVYAGCGGLTALATDAWHLAALRFVGALGMGGEWALGVALVMEVWPDGSRGRLAAAVGAAGNLGYAVVGGVALALNRVAVGLPDRLTALGLPPDVVTALTLNQNWRLLMLVGALPAGLTLVIRLAVAESPKWQAATAGRPKPPVTDLLPVVAGAAVGVGLVGVWLAAIDPAARTALTVAGLAAVAGCFLEPARRAARSGGPDIRRAMLLGAGLAAVPLLATWAGLMWMYLWVGELTGGTDPDAVPLTQISSSLGAAAGSATGALLAARFGRRRVYALLCVTAAAALFAFYRLNTHFGPAFVASAGGLGFACAAFYGWLPLALPELFPTRLRATGQGFAFNFGRMVAAVGTLQSGALLAAFGHDYAAACSLVAAVYGAGLVLIAVTPKTRTMRE